MLFKELLQRREDELLTERRRLERIAWVRSTREYGAEPEFKQTPERDAYTFVFDGMRLEISGPLLQAWQADPNGARLAMEYYTEALLFTVRGRK